MPSDVSVSFGADASGLLAALNDIQSNLKTTTAALAGLGDGRKQIDTLGQATKQWQQALAPVDRAFNQTINGIIKGTETGQQAIRRFSQQMVSSLIEDAEKSVENWIASELAKTTATEIGATARGAAENQGQAAGLVKLVELALQAIGIDAAKTFADVFAFFAPEMGPAAGAPAAAASSLVLGAGSAIGTLAVGAWEIPGDMLAVIHRGETVMPADFASGFRAAVGGGGGRGGSPSAQISIAAMDGASVKRVLGANHGAVASALRQAWRSGSGHLR